MKVSNLSIPLLMFVVFGCGGGGGGSSENSPGEPAGTEFAFGTLSGRAASTNPPKTTTSPYVTATALTGIITSLRLRDQELAEGEGRIVFLSRLTNETNYDVFSCNLDGTDLVQITNTPGINESASTVSPDGKKIAFSAVGPGGDHEIYMMNVDGSSRVQLTNNDANDFEPRWAPTSTSLAFQSAGDIFLVNVNSKVVTQLTNDAFSDESPEFTADGQSVIFASANRDGDGFYRLHRVPSGGGVVTYYFNEPGSNVLYPRLSRDGFQTMYFSGGGDRHRYFTTSGPPASGPADALIPMVDWTPDSKKIVFSRLGSYSGLFISNPDGTGAVEIRPDLRTGKTYGSVVPAPKEVTFVGGASLFGSRLSGFVFSQMDEKVRGLLGFDAATPTSAVVTEQTGLNSQAPNLVFSIDADVVTDISYAHGPYWKATRVVGGGTSIGSATGALVSLSSTSGKIVAVLPFTGSRSAGASVVDEGGTRVFRGEFLGVFDSSGENLGRASEVRLDIASGTLSID